MKEKMDWISHFSKNEGLLSFSGRLATAMAQQGATLGRRTKKWGAVENMEGEPSG